MFYGATVNSEYYRKHGTADPVSSRIVGVSFAAALVTLAGATALSIWNIFDAIRVAEVTSALVRMSEPSPPR